MYTVPQHINPNKIFIVNRSTLVGRFDAAYYSEKLDFSNTIKLSDIATIKGGKRIPLGYDYSKEETQNLYLRVANMNDEEDFNFNNLKYISDELYQILKRYEVFNNDLIISIAGTIGKIKILSGIPDGKKIILTENCAKVLIHNKFVLPSFLLLVLQTSFLKKQIALNYIQTTIPKLGLDKINSLRLPQFPSLDIQQQIINFYESVYVQKQQKETEALALLGSIDKYLLNELEITLPEKDNSIENRIFITQLNKITGGRFDVFAILNKNRKVEGGKFANFRLKKLATLVKGQSITSDKIIAGNYPVIAGGQTSPYTHNKYNHKKNIITVSASGAYSGYVWYHTSPIFASDCTVIKSRNEDIITTPFLFEILKAKQQEIYNLQQGAGQPHVYARDLEKLNIPLPLTDKQNEIVSHIQNIRKKAMALQQEAKHILENAKQQIEKMILGD